MRFTRLRGFDGVASGCTLVHPVRINALNSAAPWSSPTLGDNAVYLSLINGFFTIVNARGAAERRFLYNPLRQLRDEEPRSLSLWRAPEDAMPQHATAWAKREFPKLPHLVRRAFSQAYLAYFPGTPSPEANASGFKQIAHPALLLS